MFLTDAEELSCQSLHRRNLPSRPLYRRNLTYQQLYRSKLPSQPLYQSNLPSQPLYRRNLPSQALWRRNFSLNDGIRGGYPLNDYIEVTYPSTIAPKELPSLNHYTGGISIAQPLHRRIFPSEPLYPIIMLTHVPIDSFAYDATRLVAPYEGRVNWMGYTYDIMYVCIYALYMDVWSKPRVIPRTISVATSSREHSAVFDDIVRCAPLNR